MIERVKEKETRNKILFLSGKLDISNMPSPLIITLKKYITFAVVVVNSKEHVCYSQQLSAKSAL